MSQAEDFITFNDPDDDGKISIIPSEVKMIYGQNKTSVISTKQGKIAKVDGGHDETLAKIRAALGLPEAA